MNKGQALYKKAKRLIPGGTQLLSKRPEMFLPELWPAYYERANGCEIWDLDGRRYYDMSNMGVGSCVLGYADPDVDSAVKKAVCRGTMTTLNCPEEVELAEMLCSIHRWADMVRYARCGGEAMAVAVRIARAKRGRDLILFCGYHGWQDWYLAANLADDKSLDGHLLPGLCPKGVPRGLKKTAIPFSYNDTQGFLKLMKEHKGRIAAVVIEPIRNEYPKDGFLTIIREMTKKEGIVFIIDEITAGWRLTAGGAHLKLWVSPDMAVFAKAMSNGYPMAAIIGKSRVMEAAQETFISSTYWTERIGPVAAIATIKKIKDKKVPDHLNRIGQSVQSGWKALADKHDVSITISGIMPLGHFVFKHDKPMALKTLFTQKMLERGFLASTGFYASYAHKEKHVNAYLDAVDHVFGFIKKAIGSGNPERYLKGPVCHSGFKRVA